MISWLEITSDRDSEGVLLATSAISEIRKVDDHAVFVMTNGNIYQIHHMKYQQALDAYKNEAKQC